MKRLMRAYKENSKATEGIVEYYNANRDLRILLDLLATNYGMGRAMAAMTLFDTVIFMTQFNTQYHNYLLKLLYLCKTVPYPQIYCIVSLHKPCLV